MNRPDFSGSWLLLSSLDWTTVLGISVSHQHPGGLGLDALVSDSGTVEKPFFDGCNFNHIMFTCTTCRSGAHGPAPRNKERLLKAERFQLKTNHKGCDVLLSRAPELAVTELLSRTTATQQPNPPSPDPKQTDERVVWLPAPPLGQRDSGKRTHG